MQVDFEMPAADIAEIGIETSSLPTAPETDNEQAIAANDNEMRWPLVPFPERWYASF